MTSANFRTEGEVDDFTDMFTKFNNKGENKSTFSFNNFCGYIQYMMISILFTTFTASSSVSGLKEKWFKNVGFKKKTIGLYFWGYNEPKCLVS